MLAIVVVASITLLGSFICSLFEATLYSVTRTQVELLKQKKIFGADKLAELRTDIDEPIAAILTINTIANTAGSAVCGFLVGDLYGDYLLGFFTVVLTLTVLLFAEIVPKSLGVEYAGYLAPRIAWPLQWMIWLVWPIVKACGKTMDLLTGTGKENVPTEDEIMTMSRLAVRGGKLRPEELRWVENALRLDKVKASDLMTPRTVVYRLPADLLLSEVSEKSQHWIHSRLPLTEDRDPDRILGMVYRREVFDALARDEHDRTLRSLMHEIDFVPEAMRGHQLLDKFIREQKHMVAVVDEYGGFEGVVSLEDVLECMLGLEIVDEHDRHTDMQDFARQKAEELRKRTGSRQPS